MKEIKIIPAQALVEVKTEFGKYCLWEIKGLKEGVVLEGRYNPVNKAFDFSFNAVKKLCCGLVRTEGL